MTCIYSKYGTTIEIVDNTSKSEEQELENENL